MIKVFITDDHYMVVEGIRSLLLHENDIELIGSASSVASCRAFLARKQPDIILLDINLPDGNGIDLCLELREKYPALYILGLSTFNQESYIRKMIENGASGYVLKNATQQELSDAIHSVSKGKSYLAFEAAKTLSAGQKLPTGNLVVGRREKEVLQLITLGCTSGEIAQKLNISINTVETYRKSLLSKLNARNTADLIRLAFLNKIISLE
jgi:DNA-binding NarL/FixJ family response regulator